MTKSKNVIYLAVTAIFVYILWYFLLFPCSKQSQFILLDLFHKESFPFQGFFFFPLFFSSHLQNFIT